MRALTVDVKEAHGRVLCCTIFRSGGKKLLPKGRQLSEEDVRLLEDEGLLNVWVTEVEEGELSEDEVIAQIAPHVACGSAEIRFAAGGRANLIAKQNCCALVDDELLRRINCTASTVIASVSNLRLVRSGERLATVKCAPFAVPKSHVSEVLAILSERGPILQARPIESPTVAVLYSDPISGDRARGLFESVMQQRLGNYGVMPRYVLSAVEEENALSSALEHMLRAKPDVILLASTTAPAGPNDVVGRAMMQTGCAFERFLAPVEPGTLLLLGYRDGVPVVSAPGCYRSAKANAIDLILPALLARYRVSGWDIACLGHGGLLA